MLSKDKYIVSSISVNTSDCKGIASSLYCPLLGLKAYSLYLLLVEQSDRFKSYFPIEYLCALTNLDLTELENQLHILEKFSLIRTYQNEDKFVFVLNAPINQSAILNHEVFSRILANKLPSSLFQLLMSNYIENPIDLSQFKDISEKLDLSLLAQWNKEDEEKYQKQRNEIINNEIQIDFDYNAFLNHKMMARYFPISLRSKENMDLIGYYATIFAIPIEEMQSFVFKCVDEEAGTFDKNHLYNLCVDCKKVASNKQSSVGESNYSDNPVSFLKQLQGKPVAGADKKEIEYMLTGLNLPIEVVNYTLEYCFLNNGKITKSYIEKIATDLAVNNVDTIEKAKSRFNDAEYGRNKKNTVFTKKEYEAINEEELDIEALRKSLFGEE